MSNFKRMGTTYAADAITGERMNINDRVIDTGHVSRDTLWFRKTKNRFVKESTLVELVEKAGWKICDCGDTKPDDSSAGVSSPAPRVVNEDVGVGTGEAEVGEPKAGGRKASSRRSNGPIKS